jgi:cysteine-rich repeat protein
MRILRRSLLVLGTVIVAFGGCGSIVEEDPDPVCGDGVTSGTEACDSDGVDSADCNADCTAVACGDGHVNGAAGEACDDGNTAGGDGCGPGCLADFDNGSFETADYAGWQLAENSGRPDAGVWGIGRTGTVLTEADTLFDHHDQIETQVGCLGVANLTLTSTDGDYVAYNVQTNSEQHRLYQDVALSPGTRSLSWDMFYASLGAFDPTSQYLAIRVRDPDSDAVLGTLFQTTEGTNPAMLDGMTSFTVDLAPHAGRTVRIDVDLMVMNDCFNAMFDNFRIR